MEKHPLHIKNPELQMSEEVEKAVEHTLPHEERLKIRKNRDFQKSGHHGSLEKVSIPNDPTARIDAYIDRLENIFLNPNKEKRERNFELFRHKIYDALIIKRENFPESYFELQQRIARERGQAVEVIPDKVREQMKSVAIEDQRASLDAWIEYLSSDDAVYPAWYKYFVWKNITKLSQFDKERGEFKKRTETTVAPYPDIYSEPLAQIADIYEQVKEDNKNLKDPEIQDAFSKKFPTLYAECIQKSLAAQLENKEETKGRWTKYEHECKGDPEKLFKSLENKGTGWCTAGYQTAKTQIESGDFYVYYTNDATGKPAQPRIAIRMEEHRIAEVRGILPHQGLEPVMQEILDKKLNEFGSEADVYRKKSEDMRKMTALTEKQKNKETFTKEDLIFLYELNSTIEGFGYKKDPRIEELRSQRNTEEDMPLVFECTKDQIAHTLKEIKETTKAYVGRLQPGIFNKIQNYNIEHIYTSFPEGRIRKENLVIGGKTAQELESELRKSKINISGYAQDMMKSKDFTVSSKQESKSLVRLRVKDLGFTEYPTIEKLYTRAQELGLDICPAEVGPHYRLRYKDQPMGEWLYVAMKPISDRGGDPGVFFVGRRGGGLWLDGGWAGPAREWSPGHEFVFRLR